MSGVLNIDVPAAYWAFRIPAEILAMQFGQKNTSSIPSSSVYRSLHRLRYYKTCYHITLIKVHINRRFYVEKSTWAFLCGGVPAEDCIIRSAHIIAHILIRRFLGLSACQKSPVRTFLPTLSAEHFERVQNVVTESLEVSRLSTAVYPIWGGPCPLKLPRCSVIWL